MKTLEQAAEMPGITKNDIGLRCHFDPLPNWYGCVGGFDCPICDKPIDWKWEGQMPGFTNPASTSHLKPVVTGAILIGHGHRWIEVECESCHTKLMADNFD